MLLGGTEGCAVGPSLLSSYFPFVVAVVFLILVLVPVVQLLRRTGHNPVGVYSPSFRS